MISLPLQLVVGQIGIIVPNLEAAVHAMWQSTGIGPWKFYTNSAPPLAYQYHDHPASYKVRVAIAYSGQMQVEFIQYIEGESMHRDFLNSGRQGLEHIGTFVTNLDEALKPYLDQGIQVIQYGAGLGTSKDGRYAYLDTESLFGTVLELIQASSSPSVFEKTYP